MQTRYSNIATCWADLIIHTLIASGISDLCLAPGSRSGALAIAAASHTGLTLHVHYDERSLGFFALGLSKASQKPVAILTTSGTAIANLFPAIVEAYEFQNPLIILTADRPPELIGIGANQAINQHNFYGTFVHKETQLPVPSTDISAQELTKIIHNTLQISIQKKGPVHINCPFREPFMPTENTEDFSKYLQSLDIKKSMPLSEQKPLPNNIQKTDYILAGHTPISPDEILKLSEKNNTKIIPDILSPLRFTKHPNIINNAVDQLLKGTLKVTTFTKIGHRFTSRALINPQDYQTEKSTSPLAKTIETISQNLPENWNVFCGNSTPIRLWDRYAIPTKTPYPVYANRGASGIDGLISTASGIATNTHKPTFVFIGDLSFLHDLNGLYWLTKTKIPVVILVLNNNGGAIFKELPIHTTPEIYEQCFQTPTGLNLKGICDMMSISYTRTTTPEKDIEVAFKNPITRVIEWVEPPPQT
ncbi:MAG: 2-succinyl-5-enolpyruvyl-6-hydroxy-3-cyclohexene-1-carboxylic-acid synthase [Candidatus Margulisbacteria bacterium]|nr:2-succinyl-5-enolpyruvyl-6-hydroxy-3-cyclohexene-1-carboxylic-acid synthase [Candidatus Margulisiibacteriota bacterium]